MELLVFLARIPIGIYHKEAYSIDLPSKPVAFEDFCLKPVVKEMLYRSPVHTYTSVCIFELKVSCANAYPSYMRCIYSFLKNVDFVQ